MTARRRPSVLSACAAALLGLAACTDPSAPRQEIRETWPDGNPRVVMGLRGDTVFERLEYHATGQLKTRGQLWDGARHGVWNSYYDTGMPWSQVGYDRGQEHGTYRTYHPNGETAIEGAFEHGTRVGTWSFFSPEGALIRNEAIDEAVNEAANGAVNGASPAPSTSP
jgi:hypothetical protein